MSQEQQVESDRVYWDEWGAPLGLRLRSFTDKDSAEFVDQYSDLVIEVSKFGGSGRRANFMFMDRIRTVVLTLEGESQ